MKSLTSTPVTLDEIDSRLLQTLFANARTTTAELARQVGLSSPSTAERIRRLEDAGVICGYRIDVDPACLGLPLPVLLRIRPVPGQLHKVARLISELPEIVACERVTGDDCYIARAHVRSVEHMEQLIDRLTPLAMTNTSIIQSSPIDPRLPAFATRTTA